MTLEKSLARLEKMRSSGAISRPEFLRRKAEVERSFGTSAGAGPSSGPSNPSAGGGKKRKGKKSRGGGGNQGGGSGLTTWVDGGWNEVTAKTSTRYERCIVPALEDRHPGMAYALQAVQMQVEVDPTVEKVSIKFHGAVSSTTLTNSKIGTTPAELHKLDTAFVQNVAADSGVTTANFRFPAGVPRSWPLKTGETSPSVGGIFMFAVSGDVGFRYRFRWQDRVTSLKATVSGL